MNRRLSLDKQGILSPPGPPFLTPSPSPSIPASPRLQPSPSQSPFQSDVIIISNNTNQDTEKKTATPIRRQSINQINSPNVGTVVYRPSPTQSPAAASVVGPVGNEFNTTLVGSNNISLNKKAGKRIAVAYGNQYGTTSSNTSATGSCSAKTTSSKKTVVTSPPVTIASPNALRPPTPQPVTYPTSMMNAATVNQIMQQTSGIIQEQIQQQYNQFQQATHNQQYVPISPSKHNKLPQQILPKPSAQQQAPQPSPLQQQQQQQQQVQQVQPQQQHTNLEQQQAVQPQPQASPIILPTGNLNHQLLLNQMPVILQQNAPQGVQLILRQPTSQLTAPGLVIHNSRPTQMQTQQQPQQLLRIVNANGQMQLATATPTFIVSSQSNLIQQNLQGIKAQTNNPLNPLQGLTSQGPQQLAAAINSQLIGRSMAQIQNLQLNGNLAQLQMPNGLNGQFISQLPAQFQQSVTGFNQFNQLNSTSFQQLAAAAAAAGNAFQSPPPSTQQTSGDMVVTAGPNIQFTTQPTSINVSVAQSLPQQSQLIAMPPQQAQLMPTSVPTPEPIRNPTPITILPTVIVPEATAATGNPCSKTDAGSFSMIEKGQASVFDDQKRSNVHFRAWNSDTTTTTNVPAAANGPKTDATPEPENGVASASGVRKRCARRARAKKNATPAVQANATVQSRAPPPSAPVTSTGKLDLANVMKLCGIDDEDFMDTDDVHPTATASSAITSTTNATYDPNANADIMVTIPYSHNSDAPFSFTIPNVNVSNSNTRYINDGQPTALKTSMAGGRSFAETTPTMSMAIDSNKPSDRQYMINIDNNDGTPPFPLSISLPHNLEPLDKMQHGKMHLATVNGSNAIASVTSHPVTSMAQMNHVIVQQPQTSTSMISAPTLQSQINEIQNQLIGVDHRSNMSSQYVVIPSSNAHQPQTNMVITSTVAAKPNSTTTTTTATNAMPTTAVQKATKKKPAARRNGKKVTEPTINVPSQIGNIQISQIDRSKIAQSANVKAPTTIENHIQITPILDNLKPAPFVAHSSASPQTQNHSSIAMNSIQVSTTVHQQQQQQQQQQQLQQQNRQNRHHSFSTDSVADSIALQQQQLHLTIQPQPQHSQLFATQNSHQHQQQQQQSRPIQMAIQSGPSPNVHIQMATRSDQTTPAPQMTVIPQLTGSLTLSFSEDGRLLLKHNANAPQDAQSQMILQAILSGALCNVTLINEPTTTAPIISSQSAPNCVDAKPSIIVKNDPLPIPTVPTPISTSNSMHPKIQNHQIVTNAMDKQQQHTQHPQHQPMISVSSSQPKSQVVTNTIQTSASSHQMPMHTTSNHQPNTTGQLQLQNTQQTIMRKDTSVPAVVTNSNAPMFIELPKVAPNQQLFSLNTLTNQIVQLSPGLTTAALGPMERLLIVPAGINSQQLLQCLNQGQIHFNDVKTQPQQPLGTTTTSMASTPTTTSSHPPMNQIQSHAQQKAVTQANKAKNIVQPTPVVVETPKAKKTKAKKPKAETNKKSIVVDMKPTIVKTLDGQSKQVVAMKTAQVPISSMAASVTTTIFKSMATQKMITTKPIVQPKIIGNSPQTNQTIVMTTASQAVQANEALMMTAGPRMIHQAMIAVPTQHQPLIKTSIIQSKNVTVTTTTSTASTTSATLPPLISVSTSPQMVSPQYVPRVQTIQLTPQKQQMLKNVQMQIQNLSGRLQNKQLLSSIRPDLSPNNPLCNKPLPTLTNINAMNDMEIYQALQRLFIEQQNILATGKIIPTLPAHGTHTFTANVPMSSPISINASCVPAPVINVSNVVASVTTTVTTASSVPSSSIKPSIVTTMSSMTMTTTATTAPRIDSKFLQSPCRDFKSPQSPGVMLHNGTATKSPAPIVTSTPIETTNSTITQSSPMPTLPRSSPLPTITETTQQYGRQETVAPSTPSNMVSCATPAPPPPPPQPAPVPRSFLFERQLAVDQESCVQPDHRSPFQSKADAVKRLIRYHCMYSENGPDIDKHADEDEQFENAAFEVQDKYQRIMNKYQLLLIKESMRDVRTSELMMLDRLMVSDIKQEITDIQTTLKHMNKEADVVPEKSIVFNDPAATIVGEKQEGIDHETKSMAPSMGAVDVKNDRTIKCEADVIAKTSCDQQMKSFTSTSHPMTPIVTANALLSPNALDDKSSLHEALQKDHHHQHHSALDLDYPYENSAPSFDVKKEFENVDIETEITPSYIIKKCDASLSIPSLPPSVTTCQPPPTMAVAVTNMPVVTTNSTTATTVRDSLCELDSSDFNYLYNSSTSTSSATTQPTSSSSNRKKDELISCDKEPYDEWLCIQKELNLITEKRSNEHMNKCNLMDGYMDPCSAAKLSVENHFPDLFNHQSNHHDTLDGKAEEIHSPLSELFNESIVSNAVGSVGDKTVETHLENMFSDSSEFEKTDLVESRLEELFHGSSSPVQSSTSQAISNQVFGDTQQHVHSHTDFLMMHQNSTVANQMPSTATPHKRLWSSSAELLESMSPDQLHTQQKRLCMMNTYMETASTNPEEHHWMMDCQQSSTFDFMTSNDVNMDISSANNKRLWNGTNDCSGNDGVSGGGVNNIMNGLPCDTNNGNNEATNNMLMNNIDPKKQCYNNAAKNHDLELTLLGCTSSLHNDNSFDTSTMPGSGSTANTSNNSIASNFEDDINRHVQNAIDSILNLQNSESEALHYLDQSINQSIDWDSPMVSNYPPNTGATPTTAHHLSQSSALPSAAGSRTQHHLHQPNLSHYDDTSDCLISGSRSAMTDTNVDMMIDSPPTLITS